MTATFGFLDITGLRRAERQLRLVTDNTPALIAYVDAGGCFTFANDTCAQWFNRKREDIVGMRLSELLMARPIEHAGRWGKVFRGERQSFESTVKYEDGNTRNVEINLIPHFGEREAVLGAFLMVFDLTAHKHAEQQLRQAQKMEAVGQLTGGVAHDFNNILAVVSGNLELAKERLTPDSEIFGFVDKAFAASQRAAALTKRLLAFSRQESLQPEVVSINELVVGMTDLMTRVLGETIEIGRDLAQDLWLALADPRQFESALLNLALNARDALPSGGKIRITTANVQLDGRSDERRGGLPKGKYVSLAVSDSGVGMTAKVRERALQPFFTTKDVGQGSGLGLSMVYGFAKQLNGMVFIQSEVGQGTTVEILLPRAGQKQIAAKREDGLPLESVCAGECILVVEDDPEVRRLATAMLENLGYETVEAPDALAAMEVLRQTADIALVFSDVVLPRGMSGVELARAVQREGGKHKILLTTGYSREEIETDDLSAHGIELIHKPYRKAELSRKIRRILDMPS
ncbi:MAG: ATP-binding protein [Sphingomonadales bacterium]